MIEEQETNVAADGEIISGSVSIYSQLAKAQAMFAEIKKTKQGQIGNINFQYAPLDEVYAATRPMLNELGIFTNHTLRDVDDYNTEVSCNLHYEHQSITPCTLIAHHDGTSGGKGKSITYMARYTYQRAIGVIGEEDTDVQGLNDDPPANNRRQSANTSRSSKKPSEPPASNPPVEKVPTLNSCKKRVDLATSPDLLCDLIDKMLTFDPLVKDENRFNEVCQYVSQVNRARRDSDNIEWSQEDWQRVADKLVYRIEAADMERSAAGNMATQEAQLPAAKPDFDFFSAKIELCSKPDELLQFLAAADGGTKLNADLILFQRVLDKAGNYADAMLQGNKWPEKRVSDIEDAIKKIHSRITQYTNGED
jgi:hypothetical protein